VKKGSAKKSFNGSSRAGMATGVLAALGLVGGGMAAINSAPEVLFEDSHKHEIKEDACLVAGEEKIFKSDKQKLLSQIFDKGKTSPTWQAMFNHAAENNIIICFDDGLSEENNIGEASFKNNAVLLNPDFDYTALVGTTGHEIDHIINYNLDKTIYSKDKNYKESDRIALHWFGEANARLINILSAYEMEQEGHSEYMEYIMKNIRYKKMLDSFVDSLEENPDDIHAAMRASIIEFSRDKFLNSCIDNASEWINNSNAFFDESKERDILFDDDVLNKMGSVDGYGQYMNEDLREYIKNSIAIVDDKVVVNTIVPSRLGMTIKGSPKSSM
jgi:hypothetical protein